MDWNTLLPSYQYGCFTGAVVKHFGEAALLLHVWQVGFLVIRRFDRWVSL